MTQPTPDDVLRLYIHENGTTLGSAVARQLLELREAVRGLLQMEMADDAFHCTPLEWDGEETKAVLRLLPEHAEKP